MSRTRPASGASNQTERAERAIETERAERAIRQSAMREQTFEQHDSAREQAPGNGSHEVPHRVR